MKPCQHQSLCWKAPPCRTMATFLSLETWCAHVCVHAYIYIYIYSIMKCLLCLHAPVSGHPTPSSGILKAPSIHSQCTDRHAGKKTHTHKIKTNKSIRFIYYIAVLRVLYVGCLVLVRMGQATLEATDTRISQRCSFVNNLQLAASLACAQHLSMVPRNHCSQGSQGGESCICWEMILIAVCAPPDRGCQVATTNFKQARSSRL